MSSSAPDTRRFPDGFLWGAATAAHQIEGGNVNNDWWDFEHDPSSGCAESSGDACDSWHRWPDDLALAADLGLGAYRFSLEWSRIEPAPGEWSRAALDHYRRLCVGCHERGMVPVVTLHHFTSPRWFAARGGWEADDAPELFGRFVGQVARELGDVIGWACTLNEPNVVAVLGYMQGIYPPGVQDLGRYDTVNRALVEAHRRGVAAWRADGGQGPVGLTLSMDELHAEPGGEVIRDAAQAMLEDTFLEATGDDDFVGVQAYTRLRFGPEGELGPAPGARLTQMGTEFWPGALEHTVRRAASVSGRPVLVTENGLASDDDTERVEYLSAALAGLHRATSDGVDVRGYFVWSLVDNFEWNQGFAIRLGLAACDRQTFARVPKASAAWYREVVARNGLGSLPLPGEGASAAPEHPSGSAAPRGAARDRAGRPGEAG